MDLKSCKTQLLLVYSLPLTYSLLLGLCNCISIVRKRISGLFLISRLEKNMNTFKGTTLQNSTYNQWCCKVFLTFYKIPFWLCRSTWIITFCTLEVELVDTVWLDSQLLDTLVYLSFLSIANTLNGIRPTPGPPLLYLNG